MRMRNGDYALLQDVRAALDENGRDDLSAQLGEMLRRFEQKREKTRAANRLRARENRNRQIKGGE